MKIRTDFVTNSSSSSFCSVHAESSKLGEILNKYKDLFSNDCKSDNGLTKSGFDFKEEDSEDIEYLYGINNEDDIARYVIDYISNCAETSSDEERDNLIDELGKNKKEIMETMKFRCYFDNSYSDFDSDAIDALAEYIGLKEGEYDDDDWEDILTKAEEKSEEEGPGYLWVKEEYNCSFDGKSGEGFKSDFSIKVDA